MAIRTVFPPKVDRITAVISEEVDYRIGQQPIQDLGCKEV
jgi:hypothetical protein